MDIIRRTYVMFVDEYSNRVEEFNSRDPKLVRPKSGYHSFHFYDVLETSVNVNGESVTFFSDPLDPSPRYYFGKRTWTYREIRDAYRAARRTGAEYERYEQALGTQGSCFVESLSGKFVAMTDEATFVQIESK